MTNPVLTAEQEERVRAVNARIAPFRAEAYVQYDSDGPDEYRCKIMSPAGDELARYLHIEDMIPHAIHLMVCAMREWGDVQYRLGKEHAVDKITKHLRSVV